MTIDEEKYDSVWQKRKYLSSLINKFPAGSIVYYVKKRGYVWEVSFGTVLEHYPSGVYIQLYEVADKRIVNGVPINELVTPTEWQKLPKGWTYSTDLVQITHGEYPKIDCIDVTNPKSLMAAISCGIFVPVQDNSHANFEEEISKEKGWRIVTRYIPYSLWINSTTLMYHDVFSTYDEAKEVVDKHEAELKRQSELSYYDWSVEQIDKTLDMWAGIYGTEDEKQAYRDWLLALDDVENVEVRISLGNIQWKYFKNKRWNNIEL